MHANISRGRAFRVVIVMCAAVFAACSNPLTSSQSLGLPDAQPHGPGWDVQVQVRNESSKVVRFLVYTGYDVGPWYKDADLCIVPEQSGSGIGTYDHPGWGRHIWFTAEIHSDKTGCNPHLFRFQTPEINIDIPRVYNGTKGYDVRVYDQIENGKVRGYCLQYREQGRDFWETASCTAIP